MTGSQNSIKSLKSSKAFLRFKTRGLKPCTDVRKENFLDDRYYEINLEYYTIITKYNLK